MSHSVGVCLVSNPGGNAEDHPIKCQSTRVGGTPAPKGFILAQERGLSDKMCRVICRLVNTERREGKEFANVIQSEERERLLLPSSSPSSQVAYQFRKKLLETLERPSPSVVRPRLKG